MFTGLVQAIGVITAHGRQSLSVKTAVAFTGLQHGESIAVNGACLTLEAFDAHGNLHFHTLDETLRRTNLGALAASGGKVNLERALRVGDAVGGHLVSGHVDGVGKVVAWRDAPGGDFELEIAADAELMPFIAAKGSIAIDGISLTVVKVGAAAFSVALIPVTMHETALEARRCGGLVNLEIDLIARYVRRQLEFAARGKGSEITMQTLFQAGFMEQ